MSHPIEGLMSSTLKSIKEMIDVNTIVGDAVETPDGTVIIPISKVSFGFVSGGSEFGGAKSGASEPNALPFGGGSGAGVNINPIAFLVVNKDNVKLLPVSHHSPLEKVMDLVPDLVDKVRGMFRDEHHSEEDVENAIKVKIKTDSE